LQKAAIKRMHGHYGAAIGNGVGKLRGYESIIGIGIIAHVIIPARQ